MSGVPAGQGGLAAGAQIAGGMYRRAQSTVAGLDAESGEVAAEADMVGARGFSGSGVIRDQARAQAAALAPMSNSAAGMRLLVSTMDGHVAAMPQQLSTTSAENQALAARLRQVAASYQSQTNLPKSSGGPGGTVQAAGFGQAPQAPPRIPPPEAPWEYNIDLTSEIDGYKDGLPPVNAGAITSIDDLWNELHRCFNCNFPMGGAPAAFPHVGDELPLEIRVAGQKLLSFPVKVTEIEKGANDINIEFLTLPGHVDGPGSTIHFHFYESGGQLHLGIRGFITQGPGSGDIPVFDNLLRTGYTEVAYETWQPYINNVTRNVAGAKGFFTTGPGR